MPACHWFEDADEPAKASQGTSTGGSYCIFFRIGSNPDIRRSFAGTVTFTRWLANLAQAQALMVVNQILSEGGSFAPARAVWG
jgi:hypothetical protein